MSEELTAEEFLRIQKIEYIFTAKTSKGNRYNVGIDEVMEAYAKAKTDGLKTENEALKDCLRKLTKSGLKEKIEARMKAQELLNQTTT